MNCELVLLVGTNPLPIYITAEWFLKNNKKTGKQIKRIYLVHSEKNNNQAGTLVYAEKLKEILENHCSNIDVTLAALTDVSSAKNIKEDINNRFKDNNSHIHLNYTGGTKSMAVHVYSALKDKFENNISFSYLDARSYTLKEDKEYYITNGTTGDLRKEIKITLKELLALHDYKELKPENHLDWGNTIGEFKKIIDTDTLNEYLKWTKDFLRKVYYWDEDDKFLLSGQDGCKNRFENHVNKDDVKALTERFYIELLKSIPQDYSPITDENIIWRPSEKDTNGTVYERLKPSIKFLDGTWLEYYIVCLLKNYNLSSVDFCGDYFRHSLKAKKPEVKNFELDIAMLLGYQLIGISVTTDSSRGQCKLKGFEVLHRVRQIGGDESRAILVCCRSNVEELEDDIRISTGSSRKNFKIIGIENLKADNLINRIKEFIE